MTTTQLLLNSNSFELLIARIECRSSKVALLLASSNCEELESLPREVLLRT